MEERKRAVPIQSSHYAVKKKMKLETSRKKKPGFDDEIFNETTYYIKDGLRYVNPYYFTFTTYAKGRWVGSTVYDVFCREFQSESPEYYESAIKAGKVTVNGRTATRDTVIEDNALICHRVHRHEPPVTAKPLTIIHQDKDLVILDKPSSIPIHPCGRYRHNTIVFLLGREYNLRNLHTVHRLDRLTSGLLILAKSIHRAQELAEEIRERTVTKVYVCRVQGEFPSSPVECTQPILVFSHKLGLSRVDTEGKPCSTCFTRLSYNGETSVVQCEPKTGRMHQIRVHLQWLGYPIVNDPLYNHPSWRCGEGYNHPSQRCGKGANKSPCIGTGAGDSSKADGGTSKADNSVDKRSDKDGDKSERGKKFEKELDEQPYLERVVSGIIQSRLGLTSKVVSCRKGSEEGVTENGGGEVKVEDSDGSGKDKQIRKDTSDRTTDEKLWRIDSSSSATSEKRSDDIDCTECNLSRPIPSPKDLVMYLHALSYKGKGWSFSTSMPDWAHPEWNSS